MQKGILVSNDWIFPYAYQDKRRRDTLHNHLQCQKHCRKHYGSHNRRWQIKDRVSIDERPIIVEKRSRIGDWEADTIICKTGGAVLVNLAVRKTRLVILAKAPYKSANEVTERTYSSYFCLCWTGFIL